MKKSLRLPFSLLLVIAVFTLLTCRTAVRRGLGSGSPFFPPEGSAPALDPLLNATLLRLAAADPADASLPRDVDDLLDGNFPSLPSSRARPRPRTISLYRRENHPDSPLHRRGSAAHYPIRLRSPNDYRVLPEFRRSLRDWFRNRHFHPYILSDLLHQVKRPISGSASPYPSCAVVGNSGILLKSDHGALIDGHDLVIRLNNARTEGYHKNVGSKTGLSFVNSNILHLCARRESCFCHPYGETVPIIMYVCQAVHFLDYTVCNSSHKAPLLVTDIRFDLLCSRIVRFYSLKRFVEETGKPPEEWARVHDEKMFHYSSGMQAVMLALGICDKVSVFGFGKSTEAKHHYHTNQKAELDLHDYVAEYALYQDLAEQPQVIPFLKDSGFKLPPLVFYH